VPLLLLALVVVAVVLVAVVVVPVCVLRTGGLGDVGNDKGWVGRRLEPNHLGLGRECSLKGAYGGRRSGSGSGTGSRVCGSDCLLPL
jgi:hypothetical protein